MSAPITPPRRTTSNPAYHALVHSGTVSHGPARPNSPSPSTSGFSLIGADEAEHANDYEYWSYNTSIPYKGFGSFGRRAAIHSTPTLNYFSSSTSSPSSSSGVSAQNSSLKTLFPRLWDVLISSPTRNILSTSSPRSALSVSPTASCPHRRHSTYNGFNSHSHPHTPPLGRLTKGKARACQCACRMYSAPDNDFPDSESSDSSSVRHSISSQYSYINYSDLPPLDGEEGELVDVDDEACFVPLNHIRYTWRGGSKQSFSRARVVTGIDILSLLPTELALHVLVLLASEHVVSSPSHRTPRTARASQLLFQVATATSIPEHRLQDILACSLVSKSWRHLALDNSVWRVLFEFRWGDGRVGGGITKDTEWVQTYLRRRDMVVGEKKLPALPAGEGASFPEVASMTTLDYFLLYQERLELDRRWAGSAFTKRISVTPTSSPMPSNAQLTLPHSRTASLTPIYTPESSPMSSSSSFRYSTSTSTIVGASGTRHSRLSPNDAFSISEHWDKWEPEILKLSGHNDSVYCIELPSSTTFAADKYFITGSRDRTIKMWSARTGRCIGTFSGHSGSVLCLKFVWDGEGDELMADDTNIDENGLNHELELEDVARNRNRYRYSNGSQDVMGRRGTLYSGSSDCTICVWDVWVIPRGSSNQASDTALADQDQYEAKAHVHTVLRGHTSGVLDLRVDNDWVVSCSKDTTIRVWDRRTLKPHRTLRGHEGPVNAVGMEGGRVVSASGDGKMILWDVYSGERLRTFEGHDRGLACIEFQNGLIISGSNDWKIKIWSAYTGECLRTLQGHEALVRALAFDPRSGLLVSVSYDKSVRVWDVKDVLDGRDSIRDEANDNSSMLRVFKNAHTSHIFDVKFDVGRIVSTSHDQKIVVADFSRGLESAELFV